MRTRIVGLTLLAFVMVAPLLTLLLAKLIQCSYHRRVTCCGGGRGGRVMTAEGAAVLAEVEVQGHFYEDFASVLPVAEAEIHMVTLGQAELQDDPPSYLRVEGLEGFDPREQAETAYTIAEVAQVDHAGLVDQFGHVGLVGQVGQAGRMNQSRLQQWGLPWSRRQMEPMQQQQQQGVNGDQSDDVASNRLAQMSLLFRLRGWITQLQQQHYPLQQQQREQLEPPIESLRDARDSDWAYVADFPAVGGGGEEEGAGAASDWVFAISSSDDAADPAAADSVYAVVSVGTDDDASDMPAGGEWRYSLAASTDAAGHPVA